MNGLEALLITSNIVLFSFLFLAYFYGYEKKSNEIRKKESVRILKEQEDRMLIDRACSEVAATYGLTRPGSWTTPKNSTKKGNVK